MNGGKKSIKNRFEKLNAASSSAKNVLVSTQRYIIIVSLICFTVLALSRQKLKFE